MSRYSLAVFCFSLPVIAFSAGDAHAQGGSSVFGSGQSPFGGSSSVGRGSGFGGGLSSSLGGGGGISRGGLGGQPGAFAAGSGIGGQTNVGAADLRGRNTENAQAVLEGILGTDRRINRLERFARRSSRRRRGNQQADAPPPIRVRLKLGFTPPAPTASVATATTERINAMLADRGYGSAAIVIEGRVAVLSGSVADAGESRVLERLVRLEPGVDRVENQLALAAGAPELILPPPPAGR